VSLTTIIAAELLTNINKTLRNLHELSATMQAGYVVQCSAEQCRAVQSSAVQCSAVQCTTFVREPRFSKSTSNVCLLMATLCFVMGRHRTVCLGRQCQSICVWCRSWRESLKGLLNKCVLSEQGLSSKFATPAAPAIFTLEDQLSSSILRKVTG
jgi:hypothetical protein